MNICPYIVPQNVSTAYLRLSALTNERSMLLFGEDSNPELYLAFINLYVRCGMHALSLVLVIIVSVLL